MRPILFHWNFITLYTYGLFVAIAMGAAFFYCEKKKSYLAPHEAQVTELLFIIFVSGIIGARLFYVLQHISDYRVQFWRVFFIQEGGLVWYGGFLGGLAAGITFVVRRRLPLFKFADFFAPIAALAHGIGRVGCFMNGCCYGLPGHPVQLYEAGLLFILSFFLYLALSRKRRDGNVFLLYVAFYGMIRFGVEFFRGDQETIGLWTLPQWISLALVVAASGFILRQNLKKA